MSESLKFQKVMENLRAQGKWHPSTPESANVEITFINPEPVRLRRNTKNQSARAQRAQQDMAEIFRTYKGSAKQRAELTVRQVPLTRHYQKKYKSWDDVSNAEMRGIKARIEKGQYPDFD